MRRAGATTLAIAALSLTALLAPARAEEPVPAARRRVRSYDLRQILELADRNHPQIAAARARVLQARAQLDEAHFAPFSQFKLTGGVAVVPNIAGNNVFSPNTDVSLTSSLGVAWRAGIEGVIPLWTFGKITNLWSAAGANVRVNEASVEKERDLVPALRAELVRIAEAPSVGEISEDTAEAAQEVLAGPV